MVVSLEFVSDDVGSPDFFCLASDCLGQACALTKSRRPETAGLRYMKGPLSTGFFVSIDRTMSNNFPALGL